MENDIGLGSCMLLMCCCLLRATTPVGMHCFPEV